MRGSTRRRGSTWTALWDATDPQTGRRKQRSKGGFPTRKAAQQHLASVLAATAEGIYVEPSRQLLAQFMADEWLPAVRGRLRPLTIRKYEQILRTHIEARDIGAVPLRSLSPAHINALYAQLEREGLSVATRRLVHAVIGRALRDAQRWGRVPRNAARLADPPSLPRSRAQSWSARELRQFLDHVADDRLFACWRLAATSGLRRGELLGLPWRCVDLDSGWLRVEQQLVPTKGGCTIGPPKSRRSERTIALDAETVEALRRHRDVQALERDLAGPAYQDADLVFCDEIGRPIYPTRLGERFVKARKAAGIPSGSLHVLRHSCATIALVEGRIPLHIVAARLGDDPKTVLSTYAHLLPNSDAMAAEAVAAVLVDKPLTNTPDSQRLRAAG